VALDVGGEAEDELERFAPLIEVDALEETVVCEDAVTELVVLVALALLVPPAVLVDVLLEVVLLPLVGLVVETLGSGFPALFVLMMS